MTIVLESFDPMHIEVRTLTKSLLERCPTKPHCDRAVPRSRIKARLRNSQPVRACGAALRGSGIYFLMRDDECVYIGQSVNVLKRLAQHIDEGEKHFDDIVVWPVPRDRLRDVERVLIRTLAPQYNVKDNHGDYGAAFVQLAKDLGDEQGADLIRRKPLQEVATT